MPVNGVLILDKPKGCTSHDLVHRARLILGEKHLGHLGTLDPLATGVLPLVAGEAARLAEFAPTGKTYEACCLLDLFTDTDDVTGSPLPTPLPPTPPTPDAIRAACLSLIDVVEQVPPMMSAVKKDGVRLYKLARKGLTVDRAARPVTIHSVEVLEADWPRVTFRVACTGGTYVRSLCRTLGERLGTGGCMESLRRLKAGPFSLEEALDWTKFEAEGKAGEIRLLPPLSLVAHLPQWKLSETQASDVLHGRVMDGPQGLQEGWTVLLNSQGKIAAMGLAEGGRLKPRKVFMAEGL